ncbi:MAG: hypothetical protein ACKVS6_13295 [Planctomycetota bacterium]
MELFPPNFIGNWLETLGPTPGVIDGILILAAAAATASFAAALQLGKRAVVIAALLTMSQAPILGAVPLDIRVSLASNIFGMLALAAAAQNKDGVYLHPIASILLVILSFLCGSPIAIAYFFGVAMLLWLRPSGGNATSPFIWSGSAMAAAAVLFVVAALQRNINFSTAPVVSAVLAFVAPAEFSPDLAQFRKNTFFTIIAVLLLLSVSAKRNRIAGILAYAFVGGIAGFVFFGETRDYLHGRSCAAFSPLAAFGWMLLIERLSATRLAKVKIGVAAAWIAFNLYFGISQFLLTKNTDLYLEQAVFAAPRSAVLREARCEVLLAKARVEPDPAARQLLNARAARILLEVPAQLPVSVRYRLIHKGINAALLAREFTIVENALINISTLADGDEQKGDAAILRARYFEIQQKTADALRCLDAAVEQYPAARGVRAYYLKTAAPFYSQQLAKAAHDKDAAGAAAATQQLDTLQKLAERDLGTENPAHTRSAALAARGRISLARGKAVEATRDFNDAKRIQPNNSDAYIGAAEVFLTQGMIEGASSELRLGIDATRPVPPTELIVMLAGVELQRGVEPEGILQILDAARASDPGSLLLIKTLAAAHVANAEKKIEKGDLAGAEKSLTIALAESPEVARVHTAMGKLRDQQKRVDEAVLCYKKAFAIEASAEHREQLAGAVKTQAIAHLYAKKRSGAVEAFLYLRSLQPASVDLGVGEDILVDEAKIEFEKGAKALQTNDTKIAKEHFEKSLQFFPDGFFALNVLGTLAAEALESEKAVDYWERALVSAKKQQIDIADFATHYNLASEFRRNGKLQKAKDMLREYLALGRGPHRVKAEALIEIIDEVGK